LTISGNKHIQLVDIAVGGRHAYAISRERELYVWGFGFYYQLCTNNINDQLEPIKIPFSKEIDQISCGYFHSALILGKELRLEDSD
jgi:hypothetical protein